MKFLNEDQHKRFLKIKEQIPDNLNGNKEIISVAYIMSSDKEIENKMTPYINWINGFDYKKMLETETFSPDEKVLAKVAIALYNNGVDLQFNEVFTALSQPQREIALHAANYKHNEKGIYELDDGNLYIN
ncbi:hypothetical protein [Lederbergia lenta]|uniref:hypothetical protein n=1 Tax=Lederbergia lenta TaxID=1467 RepID=UPI00204177B3|nr:hypothetical protein [Lederbergia lenta]MCM3113629.1 hypothetical protein [Lederbergia lenta]